MCVRTVDADPAGMAAHEALDAAGVTLYRCSLLKLSAVPLVHGRKLGSCAGMRGSVVGLVGGPAVGLGAGLAVVVDGSQQGLHR